MSLKLSFFFPLFFILIGSLYSQDYCDYEFKLPSSDDGNLQGLGIKGAIDVHGDYAIVGAFGDDTNGSQSGAAYIFERCGSEWIELQKLIPSDNVASDRYGRGVAIWGDFAIVGAPYDDDKGNNSGSAYVYQLIDGVWEFDQKLTALDGSGSDWYGWTVSIWEDYVLIGAQNDYGAVAFSGSAFIYKKVNDVWTFQTKLLAPDAGVFDNFGLSLDIRNGYVIIGADENDNVDLDTGAAYIYKNVNDSWNFEMKLIASNFAEDDKFGHDVAISDSMAVVCSLNNDTLVNDAGAVYVFKNQGSGVWIEDDILISPETIVSENFGISVDFNEQFLIAGTTTGFGLAFQTGSTYLHTYNGTSWEYEQKIFANDGDHADFYGAGSSMHGSTIMIGAMGDDSNGGNAGSAYMYHVECVPVCTKLLSPSRGDTMFYLNEVLTWADVTMADGYMLSVGSGPGLDDIFAIQDIGDTTSYFVALADQTESFVTIQPYNSFGVTQACTVESFFKDISTPCHPDMEALLALYISTDGPNWLNNTGWVEGALAIDCEPCTWYGVTCDVDGRVSGLTLDNNQLNGLIPTELGDLTNLTELFLNDNQLTGCIPISFAAYCSSTTVDLSSNPMMINDDFAPFCMNSVGACQLPCPTDIDRNGLTNGDDFGIYLGNFGLTCGAPPCPSDVDYNGVIDGDDFGEFLGNFGLSCD
ncbi:MAG: hypothetical protein ACI8XB_001043 [Patiriisocius sp.]|jgi:hypothetical protein